MCGVRVCGLYVYVCSGYVCMCISVQDSQSFLSRKAVWVNFLLGSIEKLLLAGSS